MSKFVLGRINDMLTRYGAIAVAKAHNEAKSCGKTLSALQQEFALHDGEALAWAIHDSAFIWERPLSNAFDELRNYICQQHPDWHISAIQTWVDLEKFTTRLAIKLLQRMQYPPLPAWLSKSEWMQWWTYMAILHQCYIGLREII